MELQRSAELHRGDFPRAPFHHARIALHMASVAAEVRR